MSAFFGKPKMRPQVIFCQIDTIIYRLSKNYSERTRQNQKPTDYDLRRRLFAQQKKRQKYRKHHAELVHGRDFRNVRKLRALK